MLRTVPAASVNLHSVYLQNKLANSESKYNAVEGNHKLYRFMCIPFGVRMALQLSNTE